jgi:hypothetical protein
MLDKGMPQGAVLEKLLKLIFGYYSIKIKGRGNGLMLYSLNNSND